MAQWYGALLFVLEEVGVQVQIPVGLLAFLFLFFSSIVFFLPFWLVSAYSHCCPFLALRDSCDNLFLVKFLWGCYEN